MSPALIQNFTSPALFSLFSTLILLSCATPIHPSQ